MTEPSVASSAESTPVTTTALRQRKQAGDPIVCLTAYTASMARLMDPHVDLVLVGDSLAMTIYGRETTVGVDLDTMIRHGEAVSRVCRHACVVVDLPFGWYQESPAQAFRSAARVMKDTGCAAIKLEGGAEMAETIEFLSRRGVPVLGHVGLTPQSVNVLGGFRVQGRDSGTAARILADAEAVAAAGAFAIVVEGVVESLADRITATVPVPTIGIGGSRACDGQILVVDDLLGLFEGFKPKFVKRYANLAPQAGAAIRAYADDVRTRRFPDEDHVFKG